MNIEVLMKILEWLDYAALAGCALWGAFCVVVVWRRIQQQRFRSEDAQAEFMDQIDEALAIGDFDAAIELCEDDGRAVPQPPQGPHARRAQHRGVPGDNRRNGDDVIGVQRMPEPEQEPEDEKGESRRHGDKELIRDASYKGLVLRDRRIDLVGPAEDPTLQVPDAHKARGLQLSHRLCTSCAAPTGHHDVAVAGQGGEHLA